MTRLLAALLALCLAAAAHAQTFPAKPITIVLSYAAGGPTDFLARTLAEKVSARVGQPVLVDPKPGANERVATSYLLGQPADGYTIVLVAVPHATNPTFFGTLPYDTLKDLTALVHLVDVPLVITVPVPVSVMSCSALIAMSPPVLVTLLPVATTTSLVAPVAVSVIVPAPLEVTVSFTFSVPPVAVIPTVPVPV